MNRGTNIRGGTRRLEFASIAENVFLRMQNKTASFYFIGNHRSSRCVGGCLGFRIFHWRSVICEAKPIQEYKV